jgi:hypothetical protein
MAGRWESKASYVDDPLAEYAGRPIVSGPATPGNYLGRVVVELWEQTSRAGTPIDAVSTSMDPAAEITNVDLLRRAAARLPDVVSTLESVERGSGE